jgi:hypothetical protein
LSLWGNTDQGSEALAKIGARFRHAAAQPEHQQPTPTGTGTRCYRELDGESDRTRPRASAGIGICAPVAYGVERLVLQLILADLLRADAGDECAVALYLSADQRELVLNPPQCCDSS